MTSDKQTCIMEIITRLVHGGAQETVLLITERLLQKGYRVVLAHGPGDESLLNRIPRHYENLTVLYVPEFRRRIFPVKDLMACWRIAHFLSRHQVDLVHTHTSKAGIVGRWAAKIAGVPAILHSPRGSIYHETYYPEWILQCFAAIERHTASFTDKIVTLNESEKADYVRYQIAPSDKFTTIYSGIEVQSYLKNELPAHEIKQELGIPLEGPILGYVARLTPEKGHLLCLNAFRRILETIPEAYLVLVGGGPLDSEIRRAITSLGLDHKVGMLGHRNDVSRILNAFDVCVQTSLWDGLPRAMVEALVAGKPVVATAVGGIPEMIQDKETGMLVPPNDADAIANAVVAVLQLPELAKKITQNARLKMEKVFNVDHSVAKLIELYEDILQCKKR